MILDGNFIFTALKFKIDIIERIKRLLHEYDSEVHLFVLKSVVSELKQIGTKGVESLEFIKKFCKELDDRGANTENPSERLIHFLSIYAYPILEIIDILIYTYT